MNVIILAGNDKNGVAKIGVSNKALLKIKNIEMIRYVVDGLRNSQEISEISVVGPVDILKSVLNKNVDYYFESSDSIFENLEKGLEPFQNEERTLVLTSDVPWLTGESVDDFVRQCELAKPDLGYPIVNKVHIEKKFPGFKRTYVTLQEGTFTGGNIFYFNPRIVSKCKDFVVKAIASRKKPWRTVKMLGPGFLVMLLLGKLTISGLETRVSKLLKIEAKAIVTQYPEIANDIDKFIDVEMAQRHL